MDEMIKDMMYNICERWHHPPCNNLAAVKNDSLTKDTHLG